jgi:excisionase family DNA binding protein
MMRGCECLVAAAIATFAHAIASHTAYALLSVPTNEKSLDKSRKPWERTERHRIVTWGRSAAACAQHPDTKSAENGPFAGAPGGSRTPGPRLRRPVEACPRSSKASQAFATTRDKAGGDSSASQLFAPFTEDSADRLRTLLTVSEVAAYLRISTAPWYELCAGGKLPHVRVFNAIRIAPCDLQAFVRRG